MPDVAARVRQEPKDMSANTLNHPQLRIGVKIMSHTTAHWMRTQDTCGMICSMDSEPTDASHMCNVNFVSTCLN
jgi:hypothetical protein